MKDSKFIKILQELPNFYEICIRYKRTKLRAIVKFLLASHFNESVAIDTKKSVITKYCTQSTIKQDKMSMLGFWNLRI